jgi:cell wall-associated NlpC family hydrolase
MRHTRFFSRLGVRIALIAGLAAGTVVGLPGTSADAAGVNPFGYVDSATMSGNVVSYRGWVADPSSAGTVRVMAVIDVTPAASVLANQTRLDVARVYPTYGPSRGFAGSFTMPAGLHRLCFVAGNLGVGSDTTLWCTTLRVPVVAGSKVLGPATARPFGAFDSFGYGAAGLSVRGWTTDPDTTAPIQLDVTVNGQSYGSGLANQYRPDVAAVYPAFGASHGYQLTVPVTLSPGNYQFCVVGVNDAAGGNTILGCRMWTVLPSSPPASMGLATVSAAADAVQAQAVSTGAAPSSAFPSGASPAVRIAIATRALLQQATGRSTRPPAVTGLPAFVAATPAKAADEQLVMGRTQNLGTYPAAKSGGRAGVAHALEVFANDPLATAPSAGAGLIGAAPVLPPNGVTVQPNLPPYPTRYTKLRAEVAVDAALSRLGDVYVYAASGPATFDCSGLTQWAYASAGIGLDHFTGAQAAQGVRVAVSQLLPGDLVLFGSDLHHVGMYIGAGYMLDAPETGAYVRADKISWFGDFTLAVRP